jgi:Flp pilus assembly protein TadD
MRGATSVVNFFPDRFCVQRSLIWLGSAVLALALTLPLCAETNLTDATGAFYRGDNAVAAMGARTYLRTHPNDLAAHILLARTQIAQGNYQRAYQELLKAVRSDPKNLDALYYLGRVCITLSQAEYHQLSQMAPDSFRIHQILAQSYLAEGERQNPRKSTRQR